MQAIRSKDPQCRFLAPFATLTTICAACAGTGHSKADPAQACAACAGKGVVVVKWKATRIYQELLRDGDMSQVALQAELDRTDPPKTPHQGAPGVQKQRAGAPADAPVAAPAAPLEATIAQVKGDPQFSGKTVIVLARVALVAKQPDGAEFVFLLDGSGNLRCRMKQVLSKHQQQTLVNQLVKIQGSVVPRAEIVNTAIPHLIDCVLVK